jgi:hypothetical protein
MAKFKYLLASFGFAGFIYRKGLDLDDFKALLRSVDSKIITHAAGMTAIALLAPQYIGKNHFTLNPIDIFKKLAVTFSAVLGFNFIVSKLYDHYNIQFNEPEKISFSEGLINIIGNLLYTAASLSVQAIKHFPTLLDNTYQSFTFTLATVKNAGLRMSDEIHPKLNWLNEKSLIVVEAAQKGTCLVTTKLDQAINFLPCKDKIDQNKEYVALHILKNAGYTAGHIAVNFLIRLPDNNNVVKAILLATNEGFGLLEGNVKSLHDVGISIAHVGMMSLPYTKFLPVVDQIGVCLSEGNIVYSAYALHASKINLIAHCLYNVANIGLGLYEGNLLNSFTVLQLNPATTIPGKILSKALEGYTLFANIGMNHKDFVEQYPGTSVDLVGSFKEMQADALAQNCTQEDYFQFALHEYICSSECQSI